MTGKKNEKLQSLPKKTNRFTDWFFMAEKTYGEKFEEKHKKGLNMARIIGLVLILCCIPILRWLSSGVVKFSFLQMIFSFFFLYLLVLMYKTWIKAFWNFLKKDSIIHYIFLAVIPAMILFFGYQITKINPNPVPVKDSSNTKLDISIKQENNMTEQQYDEIIDRLNGFYSSLFTAMAVIAAILAIGAWRTVKELREKLEIVKKIEDDVLFLKEKRELAQWAQNLFDKDEEKKIMHATFSDLPDEDKRKFERVKKKIIEETTDDSWLKVIYAIYLTRIALNNDSAKKENFERAQDIFTYVTNRGALRKESDLISILFHAQGQLYWEWYGFEKKLFKEKKEKSGTLSWHDWWFSNNPAYSKLQDSKRNYEKALEDLNAKKEPKDETLGNIVVVLIELSKFQSQENERNKYLEQAFAYLDQRKKDFNTYWDNARALYYIDPNGNREKCKHLLIKAAEDIESIKNKKFFIDKISEEIQENGSIDRKGFPGEESIIIQLKEILDKKYLN